MSALTVEGLTKRFGGVTAVDRVSFALAPGEFLALIGPNGAGKTTLFNTVGGWLRADAGAVRLGERDITGLAPRRIWRMGVGRTFQITATFRSMTVRENVQMALVSHHRQSFDLLSRTRRLHVTEADALLDTVGLGARAEDAVAVLPYGDVKRLELAVALAHAPSLLLMDEPTAGMAGAERAGLMALVARILAERDLAVLFTEHDMDTVFAHAHRIVVLDRGRLIADGPPETIRRDPTVRAVYLGTEA